MHFPDNRVDAELVELTDKRFVPLMIDFVDSQHAWLACGPHKAHGLRITGNDPLGCGGHEHDNVSLGNRAVPPAA